jgi:predicted TPR repeat methyltransferase
MSAINLLNRMAGKLQHAIDVHQQGQLDVAEKIYREILKKQPSNADALHFYGVLLHQRGQSGKAIACIQRCLGIVPGYIDARLNLSNVYQESGDHQQAERALRKVIELDNQNPKAYNNLGVVLRKSKQPDNAVLYLAKAIELSPDNAEFLRNFGNVYIDLEDYASAVEYFRRSIQLQPKQNEAYRNLWQMLLRQGEHELAAEVVAEWYASDPNNPIARHHYLSTQMDDVPQRASDDYVRQTFDRFAASFDQVLQGLDYQAPQRVMEAVVDRFGKPEQNLTILDAGCGTGLCGPLLKPYALKLLGVDLSSAMLNKAHGRQVYQQLIESDLVGYLSGVNQFFDLLVSADTLCYFGCLRGFLEVTHRSLSTSGILIFTLEHCLDDAVDEYKLNHHGRYSHRIEYVLHLLADTHFQLICIKTVFLRNEAGQAVEGLLVTAEAVRS